MMLLAYFTLTAGLVIVSRELGKAQGFDSGITMGIVIGRSIERDKQAMAMKGIDECPIRSDLIDDDTKEAGFPA